MKYLFIAITMLLSSQAVALNADLHKLYRDMSQDYQDLGVDDNGLVSVEEVQYVAPIRILRLHELEDIRKVLQKCVFYKSGAQGRHLTNRNHARLVNKYLERIEVLPENVKVYEVKPISIIGLEDANCALSLRDKNESFVFQGSTGS